MGYYDDSDYGGMMDYNPNNYGAPTQLGQQSAGPQQPNFLNAFQAGVRQRKPGQNPILSGLSGYAGGGGMLGGLGSVAKFLL